MNNQINQEFSKSTMADFEIISELGKGSFGYVYKVRRRTDSKIYALKKVAFSKLNPKEKENSLNEIRILASISNKNIIEYKDAFYDNDNNALCLVMEYAEYGDLEKKILLRAKNKSFFTEYEILSILIQITKGLKNLHDKNIMHRDIKSANIFMFANDVVKIGDLNVSKILKSGLHNTQTGTPYYASPEVWDNHPYDFKSDIWSLGCLLYEISALKAPFRGTSMKMVYDKVKQGIYEPIPKFYSKSLSGLIYICLQTNPLYRPNCEQLLSLINDKLGYFNLGGKELKVFDNDNEKELFNYNMYSEKMCNRMLDNSNEEESKVDLLDTIKMPKRPYEINSILPKNRYASSATKRVHQSFLNYKGRLPRLNISELKIINTNGNRNYTREHHNSNNNTLMLKQNYSEANIHKVAKKEKRGSKFNNMNYLESRNEVDNEIKEEILSQSNNTSLNKVLNNSSSNSKYVQNNISRNCNKNIKNVQTEEEQLKANSPPKIDSNFYSKNNSEINPPKNKLILGIHNLNFNKLNKIISNTNQTNSLNNIHKITPYSKKNSKLNAILSPKSIEPNFNIINRPINLRKPLKPDNIEQNEQKNKKEKIALSELQQDISKINQIISNISHIEANNINLIYESKNTRAKIPSGPHYEQKEIKQKNQNRAASALIQRRTKNAPQRGGTSNPSELATLEAKKRITRYFNLNKDNSGLNISALPTIEKSDLYTLPNKQIFNQYNNVNNQYTIQRERDKSVERQLRMPKRVSIIPSSGKKNNESIFSNYRRNIYPIKITPIIQKENTNKTHIENDNTNHIMSLFMKNNNVEKEKEMSAVDKILREYKIIKNEL